MTMKNVRIFIVYERQDVQIIKKIVAKEDFIFGDLDLKKIDGLDSKLVSKQISPKLFEDELNSTSAIVRNFFTDQMTKIDEDLLGFINNFYEATLTPLLSYIFALDSLIQSIELSGASVSLVFPHEIRLSKNSSFFLAEHEAQSVFLYSRACAFQPYLLGKFSSKHEILYINSTRFSSQAASNIRQFIRLWGVFFLRFSFSIARCMLVHHSSVEFNKSFNLLAITRTPNKSEFIENFLTESNDLVGICVGENFGRTSKNYRFCINNIELNRFSILQMRPPKIFFVFKEYLKAAIKIATQRKIFLSINGCAIDITQSLREMLALLPDLKIYMYSLDKKIKALDNLSLVISTELKSPYAYGDFKVSIRNECKCIHLQDCDYYPSPIPIPIFGNALVIRDPESLEFYRSAWSNYGSEKVFASPIRGGSQSIGYDNPDKLIWCFFTSAVTNNDYLVLEKLSEISGVYGIDFIIKLHPRDSILKYFRYWRKFKFYRDGELSKKNLFRLFNSALTFSSAIINDLEDSKIPYFLINIDPISHFNRSTHCKISDKQEISSVNHFMDKFIWAHRNYQEFKDIFDYRKEVDKFNRSNKSFLEDLKKIVNI
jgi:hypothetical protein